MLHTSLRKAWVLGALLVALTFATPASAAHTFDLASHMPPRLSIMFAMSWFGVPGTDPQGGSDPGYGNWNVQFPACQLTNDPSQCADFGDAGLQRSVASRRRPLAGIYSASGRDAASLRRVDLMLSTLRRPCDRAGGFDAFSVQVDSVRFTSKYPQNKQSPTWDLAYRALVSFYERADAAGLTGAVVAGDDATVYWHFGSSFGLATQAERLAALQADLANLATLAAAHPSGVLVNGKPLLALYVDSALASPAEFQGVLDGARAQSGVDFYALGTTLQSPYFAAFDALTPWINLGIWASASGPSLHDRALAYSQALHAQLVGQIANYPGRALFGALAPGFDDYTEDWGACQAREVPRDPAVLAGQADYLVQLKQSGVDVRGTFLETWDDWTEGSEFEPDVSEGTAKLIGLRQGLGRLFGDPADPAGEAALTARWASFGQTYDCCFAGGACADAGAAPIAVACAPSGAGGDAGDAAEGGDGEHADAATTMPSASPDASTDVGAPPASLADGAPASAGCACDIPARGRVPPAPLVLALAAILSAVRRRRGALI